MSFLINTHMLSNRGENNADCDEPASPVLYMNNINFPSQMYNELTPQKTQDKTKWIETLADDLFTLYRDKGRPMVLAFYIHGFGLSANDARIGHAWYGSRLFANGLQQGLVVGASWPSNCSIPPYYARQYAENSTELMAAILEISPLVRGVLKAKHGSGAPELITAVIAHSMGNYLISKTLEKIKVSDENKVDCALMLAPDVDYGIFTEKSSVLNQGKAIYEMAKGNVWVFWTSHDRTLELDEHAGGWYVLGYRGPNSPISSATPNVQFINSGNVATYAIGSQYVPFEYPELSIVHSSYRFVPQLVLLQTLILRLGRKDETLAKALAAIRPDTAPHAPSQEPLDAYLYRNLRKRRDCQE